MRRLAVRVLMTFAPVVRADAIPFLLGVTVYKQSVYLDYNLAGHAVLLPERLQVTLTNTTRNYALM